MLFSLTNLKRRSVRDPDGDLAVVPKLLHGRTHLKLLEQAADLFESSVGRTRAEFDSRALEAIMGDYRLGRCIEACLLMRYAFVQPTFADVLSPEQMATLAEHGIASPSDLRFAIWDAANAGGAGFVSPPGRDRLLASLAEQWGLPPDPALLDRLVAIDSDEAAVLTRTADPPTPRDLMRQYNRGAVQTLLAHSTRVEIEASHLPGAALKRLYFVAKRRGVLVDIEAARDGGFTLALYGPEQAFGTADKYGRRLAEVTLSLLRSLMAMPDLPDVQVRAVAHLVLHDRPYRFYIGEEIMQRLEYAPQTEGVAKGRIAERGAAYSVGSVVDGEDAEPEEPSFDSMVEARLYREYRSLERQGYTHGWAVQREPEPVLAPGIVLIPDFAFTRGETRVFMEIAGFWSPSYRERKVAKLRHLAERADGEAATAMILAVPNDAVAVFAGLPFPVVPYKNRVAATDLVAMLDRDFGGIAERREAAQEQVAALRERALSAGFMPEQEVAAALQAYTRTELLERARSLDGEGCRYVGGVGLLSESAVAAARAALDRAIAAAPGQRFDLSEAASVAARALGAPSVDIESLLGLWTGFSIERPSLFEAYLLLA